MITLEKQLEAYYAQASKGHELQKASLIQKIRTIKTSATTQYKQSSWLRSKIAIAAVAILSFGLISILNLQHSGSPLTPKEAWAVTTEQTKRISTVHFKHTTDKSSVEMWFAQPNSYRMKFGNGNVLTANKATCASYSKQKNTVTIRPNRGGVDLALFLLGDLGQIFTGNTPVAHLSQSLLINEKLIHSEFVKYKGESCRKMTFLHNAARGEYYEYIIDNNKPMIYEAYLFNEKNPEKHISHIEVLDVDQVIPDKMFKIDTNDRKVIDRRTKL